MDPLVPQFSTYELEYSSDINKKMRVPDKISYDTDKSTGYNNDGAVTFRNYRVADIVMDSTNPQLKTPGYSPDLLNNSDVAPKLRASASSEARISPDTVYARSSASAGADLPGPMPNTNKSTSPVIPTTTTPTTQLVQQSASMDKVNYLESKIERLNNRLSHVEFQQTMMGSAITIYIFYRIFRWLVTS